MATAKTSPGRRVQRKVSGVDTVCWTEPSEHTKSGYEHRTADRGEVIELPADQAERLEGLGFLVAADAKVEEPAPTFTPATDEQIAGGDVAQLLAYLDQVPADDQDDERERILMLELDRPEDEQRTEILQLDPDYDPTAGLT